MQEITTEEDVDDAPPPLEVTLAALEAATILGGAGPEAAAEVLFGGGGGGLAGGLVTRALGGELVRSGARVRVRAHRLQQVVFRKHTTYTTCSMQPWLSDTLQQKDVF